MTIRKLLLFIFLTVWLLFAFFTNYGSLTKTEVALHLIFFLYFGVVARLLKALTFPAMLLASAMGTQISAISNYSIWPLVLFFASGAALSYWNRNLRSDKKSGKPRDEVQVLANGGVAMAISVVGCISGVNLEALYLVAVAAATADTWSTELGMRFGRKTYAIRSLDPVPKGLSGGVSIPGLGACFAGSALIGLFASNTLDFILIMLLGVTGSLADSYLGSRFQAGYRKPSGELTDIPGTTLAKGYPWFSNDLVNFISNFLAVALGAFILL